MINSTDLNLECPQDIAKGRSPVFTYLKLNDWLLIQDLGMLPEPLPVSSFRIEGSVVSAMSHPFGVPVSAKPRLYHPSRKILELSQCIEASRMLP